MRPGLRLAIRSLSARFARTALLAGTVALSAALIGAVACAMNSIQNSARVQVGAMVGDYDAKISPSGGGQTFGNAVLEMAKAWEGVEEASGWVAAPITASYRTDALQPSGTAWVRAQHVFSVTGVLKGFAETGPLTSLNLEAGRPPQSPGEIVIDASLAVRLSMAGRAATSAMDLPARARGQRAIPRGTHPRLPSEVSNDPAAEGLNALVGVRVGDEIEIARQSVANMDFSGIMADPVKAGEMARAAGITPSLAGLRDAFRAPLRLRVVGISKPPPFGGRPQAYALRETIGRITGRPGELGQIDLKLSKGVSPDAFVQAHAPELPRHLLLQTSSKVSSKLDKNIQAGQLGMVLATVMAFLAAGFIIATGMTTAVSERQRELGVLRCIGASRAQLAESQLFAGASIGLIGALAGLPMAVGLGWGIVRVLQSQIEVTLAVPWWGLTLAGGGALLCGLLGSLYPALMSTRISPLEALASRGKTPRRAGVLRLLAIGLALAAVQLSVVTFTTDGQTRFWLYIFVGLPALFVGYFLLAVPALAGVNAAIAPLVSRALFLPAHVLTRTLRATPYRYGFTAGSMMMGMALMVGIWTQGAAIQRDFLGRMEFPDAFVTGINLSPGAQREIERIPGVTGTCAITLHAVETDAFGLKGLQEYKSMFMAFEPETFFAMNKPLWIEGNPATALPRLEAGGAVIVAREFTLARGLGVGDVFKCRSGGREYAFEIVGVVTSPGLELVAQFFSIGENFTEQSINAVFGSRKDLKEKFGSDAVHLIQIALESDADDAKVVAEVRTRLAGAGILDVGSGRWVREQINTFVNGALLGASSIALMTMTIAGFGVANLIIAGIAARQFEFGVLHAVGASRGLVARLVLGEALIVGLTAALVGTAMGTQGVYAVQRIDELLFGLDLHLRLPLRPLLLGWGFTLAWTVAAALPAVLALRRKGPRELLGSIRG